ncbi:unnamed protein product [Protopolystoma xenopodis]|uniref:Uncharacterized protein n=1 Tax=Protopolystoma xenopodis TaxID=117903 RepID=A0A448WUD7_9PLAT|nr:unnamed protein product [Protopolystoma xenopodis]
MEDIHLSSTKSPGPGAYNTVEQSIYKTLSPHWTLVSRQPPPSDGTLKPPPNAYDPHMVKRSLKSLTTNFYLQH